MLDLWTDVSCNTTKTARYLLACEPRAKELCVVKRNYHLALHS